MIGFLLLASLASETLPDGNTFVLSLVEKQRRREALVNDFSYDELQTEEDLDGAGRPTSSQTELSEVFYVRGRPVRRVVAKNGAPLDTAHQSREDARVKRRVEELEGDPTVEERAETRLSLILERYDFRSTGREEVLGTTALVLEFRPRPGKRNLRHDNVLRTLTGRVWVQEDEREVVRAEVKNLSGIKVGLGLLASVQKVDMTLEFQKLAEDLWLPSRVSLLASGRILLFKGFRKRETLVYSRYRRFQVDSDERVAPPP